MTAMRATTSTHAVVDDPSSVQLAALVAEIEQSGTGAYLVLDRGETGGVLAAHRGVDADWQLELRGAGNATADTPRYRTTLREAALVFATLASWMRDTESWRSRTWDRVRVA